jgi:hypothetical protein
MTATYTALATITLTSTDSEIVFSSIPATYRDLVLVYDAQGGSAQEVRLALNGSTANGSFVYMLGDGSSPGSGTASALIGGTISTLRSNNILQFFDYAQTNKHKTILIRSNRPSEATLAYACRWAQTTAINSIQVYPNSGNWTSGGVFALYGIN